MCMTAWCCPLSAPPLPAADIEAICAWLTGAGDLIFGNYPNRSMRARMDAQINFDKIIRGAGGIARLRCLLFASRADMFSPLWLTSC